MKILVVVVGLILILPIMSFSVKGQVNSLNNWRAEKIDNVNAGALSSIAVDSIGNPHIAYENMYASWNGTAWIYEPMAGGIVTSLALDKNDVPHVGIAIPYSPNSTTHSGYENKSIGTWQSTVIDSMDGTGGGSIAVDNNDVVHIVYNAGTNGFKYANITKGIIQRSYIETTESGINTDRSICIDNNNRVDIAYLRSISSLQTITFASLDRGVWNKSIVSQSSLGGAGLSIAVDKNNIPHISYGLDPKGMYSTWNGSAWVSEMFDTVGYETSIALNNTGGPWISYLALTNYQLKCAYRNGTGWSNDIVDTATNGSQQMTSTSIAIDKDNFVHISYIKGYEVWYATNKPGAVIEFTTLIIPSVLLIALFVIVLKRKKIKNSQLI